MAKTLISRSLLKIISNRRAENAKRPGNQHFQISKAIFTNMKAGSNVGHRGRLVGVLRQAQMRRLPKSLIRSSQPCRLASLAASTIPSRGSRTRAMSARGPRTAMYSEVPSIDQCRHTHCDDEPRRPSAISRRRWRAHCQLRWTALPTASPQSQPILLDSRPPGSRR
jgi:hypothetical protein